ncbi:hypothetical protein BOSEA31B_20169 [Hyphomicrobiales bacterium]|jgi:hypothetical protein|nr:hypothetical protein BOSEA31B_20169 [Hyphomicrobiales bacterium]CAH1702459.1 hypothetical protein BOSEA1005_30331 [Hyphomicrobiales bacterium]CAI0346659.1 hypothetical protein BO1005MUT1_520171 [Hyphomicrobiales bacterium]
MLRKSKVNSPLLFLAIAIGVLGASLIYAGPKFAQWEREAQTNKPAEATR